MFSITYKDVSAQQSPVSGTENSEMALSIESGTKTEQLALKQSNWHQKILIMALKTN